MSFVDDLVSQIRVGQLAGTLGKSEADAWAAVEGTAGARVPHPEPRRPDRRGGRGRRRDAGLGGVLGDILGGGGGGGGGLGVLLGKGGLGGVLGGLLGRRPARLNAGRRPRHAAALRGPAGAR